MAVNDSNINQNEKLIARLTDRLAGDPELQADVARELQTHLEDATDEFRQAGLEEAQAQQEAAKALGDPDDISQQLFQANRSRMRFRAVARWAASLALLPVAVVVVVMLVSQLPLGRQPYDVSNSIPSSWERQLAEEQQFLLVGDPQANGSTTRAKSISDRWPDNPVYFGNYFVEAIGSFHPSNKVYSTDDWNENMALADRGEKLDPENAFYNFIKATWLINSSCKVGDDVARLYKVMKPSGVNESKYLYKVTITNPARFQQGLDELRLGLSKPYYSCRTIDMLRQRLSVLPPMRSMSDMIRKLTMQIWTTIPPMNEMRTMAKAVCGYAMEQAKKGDASSISLNYSLMQMADAMGKDSQTFVELLVAVAVRAIALANLEQVAGELQNSSLAQDALRERQQQEEFLQGIFKFPSVDSQELRHVGMFWGSFMPGIPGYRVEFEPMRTAENFVVLESALLFLLVLMVILSLVFGLAVLIWAVFCRQGPNKPILLFVGWARIGRIVLYSIVLPLVVYGLYAAWQMYRPGAFGLNYTFGRQMLELEILLCVVFSLLLSMSYRAIRQRCVEIGLPVPPTITRRKRFGFLITAGVILLVCGVYIVGWWAGPLQPTHSGEKYLLPFPSLNPSDSSKPAPGVILLFVVVASFFAIWLLSEAVELFRHGRKAFRRTFVRSVMPILCAAVILVGIAVGGLLVTGESYAVGRAVGDAEMTMEGEIERSAFHQLQEKFVQWQQEDGKEEGNRQ